MASILLSALAGIAPYSNTGASSIPSVYEVYADINRFEVEASCPASNELKPPHHGLENAVAQFSMNLKHIISYKNGEINQEIEMPFFFLAYNSESKSAHIDEMVGLNQIYSFLKNQKNFDIIEIFERENSGYRDKPSVTIYKPRNNEAKPRNNEAQNITYIIFSGEPDAEQSSVVCVSGWRPELVLRSGQVLIEKIFWEFMKKYGVIKEPPPSKIIWNL